MLRRSKLTPESQRPVGQSRISLWFPAKTDIAAFAVESRSGLASRRLRSRLEYGELGHNRETAPDHRMSPPRSFLRQVSPSDTPGSTYRHRRYRPWHLPGRVLAQPSSLEDNQRLRQRPGALAILYSCVVCLVFVCRLSSETDK